MAKIIRLHSTHLSRCNANPSWMIRFESRNNLLVRSARTLWHFANKVFYEAPLLISFNFSNLSSLLFSFIASTLLLLPVFLKKVWHMS